MSVVRMQTANAIVFQLLRKNLTTGEDWKELRSVQMVPMPTNIKYQHAGRSEYTQTEPEQGVLDRFGIAPTGVTLAGSFGIQPRRVGISIQDGYTRFWTFKEQLFKISHQANSPQKPGDPEYLYAVNYYDFSNSEKFAADLPALATELDAKYNTRERRYVLQIMRIGDVISATTVDPMLKVLLFADSLLNDAGNALDSLNDTVSNNPIVQGALLGLAIYDSVGPMITQLKQKVMLYANGLNAIGSSFLQSGQQTVNTTKQAASVFGVKF